MFLIVGVKDVEGIAICNLDDLAGEGIGKGGAERSTKKKGAISRGAIS